KGPACSKLRGVPAQNNGRPCSKLRVTENPVIKSKWANSPVVRPKPIAARVVESNVTAHLISLQARQLFDGSPGGCPTSPSPVRNDAGKSGSDPGTRFTRKAIRFPAHGRTCRRDSLCFARGGEFRLSIPLLRPAGD